MPRSRKIDPEMKRPPGTSTLSREWSGRTRPDPRGSGGCLVLAEPLPHGLDTFSKLSRTAASGQPPHESRCYTTSDHLPSRVQPRYPPGRQVDNVFKVIRVAGILAGTFRCLRPPA